MRRFALASLSLVIASAQQDRVVLRGNTPPQIAQAVDAGRVPDSFPLSSLAFQLQRTPQQQQALDRLLQDQQDPNSPLYHHWITPEETADRFGLSTAGIARITSWLRSQGFRIGPPARGHESIAFSGTAKQVREAFHIEIHYYRWKNQLHHSNNRDPSIPATFANTVSSLRGLDDFVPTPLN